MISLVMAARNDNYGGEVYREVEPAVPTPQKDRMRLSITTLHKAFENLDYEIVFVEWNPVLNKEKISDWDFMKHPNIRIVEVPLYFSQSVIGDLQFHEFHAKNVGIRRAEGDIILCTNPDVLWLYKIDESVFPENAPMIAWRWSVYHPVLELANDISKITEFCFKEQNRLDYDHGAQGDFTLMYRDIWFNLSGYTTITNSIAGGDQWMVKRAADYCGGKVFDYPEPIFHVRHPGRPLKSSFGITRIDENWGAPSEDFAQFCNGFKVFGK